ncbi:hypothetical protein CEXT_661381, partial [Caerostris extrusa]
MTFFPLSETRNYSEIIFLPTFPILSFSGKKTKQFLVLKESIHSVSFLITPGETQLLTQSLPQNSGKKFDPNSRLDPIFTSIHVRINYSSVDGKIEMTFLAFYKTRLRPQERAGSFRFGKIRFRFSFIYLFIFPLLFFPLFPAVLSSVRRNELLLNRIGRDSLFSRFPELRRQSVSVFHIKKKHAAI